MDSWQDEDHYPHVYRFLDKTDLTPWVDEIVISGEVKLRKIRFNAVRSLNGWR